MTAQDIIDRCREILKDDIEPYRIDDSEFFSSISDGLWEAEARRPDLLIQTDGTITAVVEITATSATISFPDRTKEMFACYTSYRSYISEDADRHNTQQATLLFGRFNSLLETI